MIAGACLGTLVTSSQTQAADQPWFKLSHDSAGGGLEVAMDEIYNPQTQGCEKILVARDLRHLCQMADDRKATQGKAGRPTLYPVGTMDRNKANRRIATEHLIARLKPGADPFAIATASGLRLARNVDAPEDMAVFEAATPAQSLVKVPDLQNSPGVESAEPILARTMNSRSTPTDPLFPLQWHLLNNFSANLDTQIDIGVTNAWDNYRGKGIMIGIVDDGVETTHPDLVEGYDKTIDWDFNDRDADPSPRRGDFHGTAVAGCAAARGNNGIGVVGVAYEARMTGLRLIGGPFGDADSAAALVHSNSIIDVKNNSWGPPDGSGTLGKLGPLTRRAMERAATEGRGGKGTIILWAAGNGGDSRDNSNYDEYANCTSVIAIGAVRDTGELCSYSEPGANVTVCAPSGDFGYRNIVTTDISGQDGYNDGATAGEDPDPSYTRNFNGTSAASPIASGVVALILQANPNLRFRDMKEILLRSASVIQPADPDWITNSAGIHHNNKFGGGLIHAQRAIDTALSWIPLAAVTNIDLVIKTGFPKQIPDNDPSGVVFEFQVTNSFFRVEDVTVTLSTTHSNWGNLQVTLISPKRVRSLLADVHPAIKTDDYRNWTFSSTRHWGEPAQGVWRVQVVDAVEKDGGRVDAVSMKIYGSTPKVASFGAVRQKDSVRLALRAPAAGWKCAIDQTTDLKNWSTLNTVTIDDTGLASYVDRSGVPGSHRFYRARVVAP